MTLRVAEHMAALNVPAALVPAVMALATQAHIDTAPPLYADDWLGVVSHVQQMSRETVEDYVAAVVAAGPVTCGIGAGGSEMTATRLVPYGMLLFISFVVRITGQSETTPTIRFVSPTDDTYLSGPVLLKVAIDGQAGPSLIEDVTFFADGRQVCVARGPSPQCGWMQEKSSKRMCFAPSAV